MLKNKHAALGVIHEAGCQCACFSCYRTAHERAHYLSEQRQNALKWPWERVVNVATSLDASDFEAQKYSDPQLYEKFK